MEGYVILGLVALMAAVVVGSKRSRDDMEDDFVSADNIREGVRNAWYNCELTIINGQPAVKLSGRMTDGQGVVDYFKVTQADWNDLKNEGYPVFEYE